LAAQYKFLSKDKPCHAPSKKTKQTEKKGKQEQDASKTIKAPKN